MILDVREVHDHGTAVNSVEPEKGQLLVLLRDDPDDLVFEVREADSDRLAARTSDQWELNLVHLISLLPVTVNQRLRL